MSYGTNQPDAYYLIPLIKRKDLTEACINLLNQEWPRSHAARENSFTKCTSEVPPLSFILLESGTDFLVGHARLCRLLNESSGCWIESVIVDPRFRNKGIGRVLMEQTEKAAKQFGFCKVYLSTKDKQGFYSKCGYHFCDPVVHVGSSKLPMIKHLTDRLLSNSTCGQQKEDQKEDHDDLQPVSFNKRCTAKLMSNSSSSPPPPPPPPSNSQPLSRLVKNDSGGECLPKASCCKKELLPSQYMCKVLI
uniref:N-acetyltransferase domain-containing protein n=1 Tax=Syphacia muris TaxID=451379 RepID=A0A0N5ADE7_9BILA